jgi:hypothetical protein
MWILPFKASHESEREMLSKPNDIAMMSQTVDLLGIDRRVINPSVVACDQLSLNRRNFAIGGLIRPSQPIFGNCG